MKKIFRILSIMALIISFTAATSYETSAKPRRGKAKTHQVHKKRKAKKAKSCPKMQSVRDWANAASNKTR